MMSLGSTNWVGSSLDVEWAPNGVVTLMDIGFPNLSLSPTFIKKDDWGSETIR